MFVAMLLARGVLSCEATRRRLSSPMYPGLYCLLFVYVLVPMIITVVKEEHINVSGHTGNALINSHAFQVLVLVSVNKLWLTWSQRIDADIFYATVKKSTSAFDAVNDAIRKNQRSLR